MPTANRRAFLPAALTCFLRQDYPHKELIILDDGDDPVGDLIPSDPAIRYLRTSPQPLGAKRNQCVEAARGDLLLHWDDDDWSAPHRLRYQLEALLAAGAEVCGLRQMIFYRLDAGEAWLYEYPAGQRPWLAGGSLLYTRDFWRRSPFPHIQVGEDARFVWSQNLDRALTLPDYRFYIAMIHSSNTSPKVCEGPYWSRWLGDVRALLGEDLLLYPSSSLPLSRPGGGPMRLNLGCCDAPLPGFTNVDLVPGPGVDQVADLRQPWPWPESSIQYVRAWDVIEHLPDKIFTMNELFRVLAPSGQAELAVPTTDGPGAFQDPTHVSFWNRRSFLYYEAGNPYRERFARHYGIQAKFRVLHERTDHSLDGPRLTIVLEAVKP
jgi:hypothetical protein